jgi:hypothetical protein
MNYLGRHCKANHAPVGQSLSRFELQKNDLKQLIRLRRVQN